MPDLQTAVSVTDEEVQRMMDLFQGYDLAHGTHGTTERNPEKNGKLEIKKTASTVSEPVTEDVWRRHLEGRRPVGIIPIMQGNVSIWGAIDIDEYDLDHQALVRRVRDMHLPFLVCRTKSGGAHLYLFLTEPVPSEDIRAKLRDLAALLGYGGSEIFPKQSEVLFDKKDRGNWLNMPYFGDDRYCIGDNGRGITLRQFLSRAEAARLTPDEMVDLRGPQEADSEWRDGPPCLQHLTATSFPEGTRNNGLFAVAIFLKKKHPDRWDEMLDQVNNRYFSPPLSSEEVEGIKKSVRRKDYRYKCSDIPLANHCNSALCRTRKFGVGAAGTLPSIENLSMLDTDEPVFFMDVDGHRIELTTVELQTPLLFQRRCMETIRVMVPVLKKQTWDQILQTLYENLIVIEAPPDAGQLGQFREHLEEFCTDRQSAKTRDEIILGKPWLCEEEHRYYFRLRDLQEYLDRARFRSLTRSQMMTRIRDMGGDSHFFNIKGRGVNVYYVPESVIQRQTETHELPLGREEVL